MPIQYLVYCIVCPKAENSQMSGVRRWAIWVSDVRAEAEDRYLVVETSPHRSREQIDVPFWVRIASRSTDGRWFNILFGAPRTQDLGPAMRPIWDLVWIMHHIDCCIFAWRGWLVEYWWDYVRLCEMMQLTDWRRKRKRGSSKKCCSSFLERPASLATAHRSSPFWGSVSANLVFE
jgi:hypothetical protein